MWGAKYRNEQRDSKCRRSWAVGLSASWDGRRRQGRTCPTSRACRRATRQACDCKVIGAALAAAFARRMTRTRQPLRREQGTLEQKSASSNHTSRDRCRCCCQARKTFSASATSATSGSLAQTWLAPNAVERVVSFWGCGSTVLARDIRRFDIFSEHNARAAPWFLLLVLNTFPDTSPHPACGPRGEQHRQERFRATCL